MRAFIARTPDQTVVGAGPDVVVGLTRRRDRVNHALPRPGLRAIGCGDRIEIRRRSRVLTRQIGTDEGPVIPAIFGAEEPLIRKVQHARIARREHERQRPGVAIVAGIRQRWIDRLSLHRSQIEPFHPAAIQDVRVPRIGRQVVALTAGGRLTEMSYVNSIDYIRMTWHAGRAGILLRSVDPIRKLVVGDDVIELAGRLVEPGAPGPPAVDGHRRALIDAEDSAIGHLGVDPERVVVVAARRALHRNKCPPAVFGTVDIHVDRIDNVGIFRLDGDSAEVPAARPDSLIAARARPCCAGVVGPIDAAFRRIDDEVDAPRHRRSHRDSDSAGFCRQTGNRVPVIAAVGCFEKSAAGSV